MVKLELAWCSAKTGQQVEVKREQSCAQCDSPSPHAERADLLEECHSTGLWLHRGSQLTVCYSKESSPQIGHETKWLGNLLIKGHESNNWQNCMLKVQHWIPKPMNFKKKLHSPSWTPVSDGLLLLFGLV